MNRFIPKPASLLLTLVFVFTGVAVWTNAVAEKRVTVATGTTSGVYYPIGGAVAKVVQSYVPDTIATHIPTNGSVENLFMIADGRADIGFAQADSGWDAYKGYGKFSKPLPVRTLAVLYPGRLQLVTLRNSGILNVRDLRGKRVSTGPAASGTEIWANRLLSASGLDPDKDIVRSSHSSSGSAVALKEGKIDAFIWGGGTPTKGIADLAKDPSVKIRMLDTGSAVPNMLRKYGPVYTDGYIVANTYQDQTSPVKSAESWAILLVRSDMDEKLAYQIVKALFEHKADLVAGHADAQNIDLSNQIRGGSPIPFHPGAKRYYLEKGLRILR